MRILLINKYYFPKGGAEKHFFGLKELLERHGHEVIVFAMEHKKNIASPFGKYFVSNVDFERVRFDWQGLRTVGRMFYSFEARRKLAALIRDTRPDIAHIHNIYNQISPSILPVLKKSGIPVVMTAHDYALCAPNYLLFCHGKICERTKPRHFWRAIGHRCIKNSFAASSVASAAIAFHRALRLYKRNIDIVLCPSEFLVTKLREYGIAMNRVVHLPNFATPHSEVLYTKGNGILFAGRLSEEKGVATLLDAVRGLDIPVTIAGTGPLEQLLYAKAELEGITNVRCIGFQSSEELAANMQASRLVVVPSLCYENAPTVITEAYAQKKPVVASRIGGIPELVEEGVTGALVPAGDAPALRETLVRLYDDTETLKRFGEQGFARLRSLGTAQYYDRLRTLYENLVQ